MLFGPDQFPRSILAGEFAVRFVGTVVVSHSGWQIIGLTNIETAHRILENVYPDHEPFKNGSAGMGETRTDWTLALTVGIPFSRWGALPFVCSPIPFPVDVIAQMNRKSKETAQRAESKLHPFDLATMWHCQIDADPNLNKAKIAIREGLSRARVTQIMNLLELPELIK